MLSLKKLINSFFRTLRLCKLSCFDSVLSSRSTLFYFEPDLWRSNLSSLLLVIKMRNWHRFLRSVHVDRCFFHNKTPVIETVSIGWLTSRTIASPRIDNRWKSERNFIINLIDLDAMNFVDFRCESRPRDFISPHFYCHGESNGALLMNFLLNFYNCGLNDREVEWQQRLWSGTMELNSLFNGRFWATSSPLDDAIIAELWLSASRLSEFGCRAVQAESCSGTWFVLRSFA